MRPALLLIVTLFASACGGPPKHAGPPVYEDYPVAKYDGPSATSLQLADTGRDTAWRAPLTPFLQAPVTFAGHLVVAAASCGDDCSMSAIVDLKSGRVYRDTTLSAFCSTYDSRPTSELLIAKPLPAGPSYPTNCSRDTRYYRWTGDTLVLLLRVPEAH